MNPNQQKLKAISEGTLNPKGFSFFKYYHVKITNVSTGFVEGKFTVLPEFLNGINTLHGGAFASIADECSGLTTYTLGLPYKFPTLDFNIHFLRPAFAGNIIVVTGKIIKQGRRIVFIEVEFYSDENLLVKALFNHSVVSDTL